MGQIHFFEALLIILSLFALTKIDKKPRMLIVAWLLLAPIPAVIVTPTPHAYRTLQMAPALAFLSALGTLFIFSKVKSKAFRLAVLIFISYYFLSYLHLLFVHYPKKFAADWQDGYRQMVQKVLEFQSNYDKVYVTNINQVPYIYLLFYGKYDPKKFLEEKGTKDAFDKYVFISSDFDVYNKGKILYVAPSWQKVNGKWLAAASDNALRHIYSLWEIGGKN